MIVLLIFPITMVMLLVSSITEFASASQFIRRRDDLKFPNMMADLFISPYSSISFCFKSLRPVLSSAKQFIIVLFAWQIYHYVVTFFNSNNAFALAFKWLSSD